MWTLRRITGPTTAPVSLSEVKKSLRLSIANNAHDEVLLSYIHAGTEQVEQDTNRVLIFQTFELAGDSFPSNGGLIGLPQKPIYSISSIHYLDSDGDNEVVDPDIYALDEGGRQVYLQPNESWPSALTHHNSVRVTYVAGYGEEPESVPRLLRDLVILSCEARFYESQIAVDRYESLVQRVIPTSYLESPL